MRDAEITLREVKAEDLPVFFLHQADPDAAAMAEFKSRDEAAFIAHWRKIMEDGLVLKRTILFNGEVAGNIVSFIVGGRREVGYWIGREYWGKGVATKALELFLEAETDRPIYAGVSKNNTASIRVLEKCGFTDAGPAENGFRLMKKE